jgi:hypothetical protein
MLCNELIALCPKTHTKHKNYLCGKRVEFMDGKPGDTYNVHPITCHEGIQGSRGTALLFPYPRH